MQEDVLQEYILKIKKLKRLCKNTREQSSSDLVAFSQEVQKDQVGMIIITIRMMMLSMIMIMRMIIGLISVMMLLMITMATIVLIIPRIGFEDNYDHAVAMDVMMNILMVMIMHVQCLYIVYEDGNCFA